MKKILITTILVSMTSIAIAGNYGIAIYTNTLNNNVTNLTQCKEMEETKIDMLSQMNMQNQICVYENYGKLTEKWITQPPQEYVPIKTIVINMNNTELSQEMKNKLKETSSQCQDMGLKMRAKLKEKYGVENFNCQNHRY